MPFSDLETRTVRRGATTLVAVAGLWATVLGSHDASAWDTNPLSAVVTSQHHLCGKNDLPEQSIQGHTWTVYGRTTDYMERTWLNIWGRATRPVTFLFNGGPGAASPLCSPG